MPRRGRGEGSIFRRADGRWHGRLRFTDPITGLAERAHFYGQSRSDVVDQLDAARRRLRAQCPPRDEPVALTDFLKLWLEDSVRPTKRAATYRSYSSIVREHLDKSRLAAIPLRDLREIQIQHVLVAKSKATSRIQQLCLIVLRCALEQAVQWNLLGSNPAAKIEPPRRQRRELRVLSAPEARRFLAEAKADRLYALYYLAIDTGMRQGELLALHWRDVDLESGAIRVVRTMDNHTGEIGPPKTAASRRAVQLGAGAVAALLAHARRQRAAEYSGALVFTNTAGGPLSPQNVRNRSFVPLQKLAKIDPPVRFHDLRHTAATLMLSAGVHPKIVSERLGHATIAITMDTYQHVSPSMQHAAAAEMDAILSPRRGLREHKGRQKRASGRQVGRS
jgi:integrase